MGTRAVSLWLRESKMQNFYAIGMDYAWGHNSIGVFESEMKRAKKNFVGAVFSPIGTKDFSTYITKIRQSGADACFIVMPGDDNNAFLSQSREYRLPDKVQLLTEVVDLASIRAVGDASLGLIGSMRYCFTIDNPENKDFVAMWQKEYGNVPDTFEGEQWQACLMLAAGIEKAGSIEAAKLRPALETVAIDGIKGHVAMRACDHQAVQHGFMVKVVKREDYPTRCPRSSPPIRASGPRRLQQDDLRRLTRMPYSPSPCGRGLGGGGLRRYWRRPLPPTPSRKGRGSRFCYSLTCTSCTDAAWTFSLSSSRNASTHCRRPRCCSFSASA